MRALVLLWKRLAIFALGVFAVWLILFVVFRFTDSRLPWIIAVPLTYGIGAYVILPRIIRFGLSITRARRLPEYTTTGDGLAGDPVNIALVGTLAELRAAFGALGWVEAEPLGLASSWRMVRSFLLNTPYPAAPFSTLYLFGRGQDVGFQKAIGNSPRKRHHVRFWSMALPQAQTSAGTDQFWLNTTRPADGVRALWVGAVTRDTGMSFTRLSFQFTHATDSDVDAERDFLMSELVSRNCVKDVTSFDEKAQLPAKRVNHYVFDGDVSIATLVAR